MTWLKCKLIELPYYDRYGKVIASINGRKNRFGKDEFSGGGRIYPDLSGYTVLHRYRNNDDFLVETKEDASVLINMDKIKSTIGTYQAKIKGKRKICIPNSIINYNVKDFKFSILTEKEAYSLLELWGINIDPESGVT